MQTTRTPYSISFMATVLLLLLFACHSTVANAAVALGSPKKQCQTISNDR